MTIFLLSLLGLPPLAGFAGKFQVFASIYEGGQTATAAGQPQLGTLFYALLGIAAVNTAISAYYYLKVVRMMLLEEPLSSGPVPQSPAASLYLLGLAAALVAAGIIWAPLLELVNRAVKSFQVW
jgi:NADH-quinone oxidoreductase subunit N